MHRVSPDGEVVGQRAHTTLGGGVHPRVCASASNVVRTCQPARASREDVNAEAGARADYPYRSPTTVVVTAWGNTPTTSTG
jgi:hypothetical protein